MDRRKQQRQIAFVKIRQAHSQQTSILLFINDLNDNMHTFRDRTYFVHVYQDIP